MKLLQGLPEGLSFTEIVDGNLKDIQPEKKWTRDTIANRLVFGQNQHLIERNPGTRKYSTTEVSYDKILFKTMLISSVQIQVQTFSTNSRIIFFQLVSGWLILIFSLAAIRDWSSTISLFFPLYLLLILKGGVEFRCDDRPSLLLAHVI